MNETQLITQHIENSILKIGLNRPDKRNAITHAMYDTMRNALESAKTNPDIRVVLIHGADDVFSAGNDLDDFNNRKEGVPSPGVLFLTTLREFEKPVVAAISGLAIGVGVTLLLHCDLVYAAPETRFRMPFVNLGVCPEAGSTLLLPARAGYLASAQTLLLGDYFDTPRALDLGIVTESVPQKTLLAHAREKASRLAKQPQEALLLTKQLMKHRFSELLADRMTVEFDHFARLMATSESKEIRARKQAKQ